MNSLGLIRDAIDQAKKLGWDIKQVYISHQKGRAVFIVRRDMDEDRAYSTHEFWNGAFFWGHYDMDLKSAEVDFIERSFK